MSLITNPRLPVFSQLRAEGLTVMSPDTAPLHSHIRVALVNLMPIKEDTELDFMRLMAPSPLSVEVVPVNMASHHSRHTSQEHISSFYTPSAEIDIDSIDGAIITGAPLEFVNFEDVDYWPELTALFDNLHQHDVPALYICWGAFAAMYHHYGVKMRLLEKKLSGVFRQEITHPESPLIQGLSSPLVIPHSRFATWLQADIEALAPELHIVACSKEAGIYIVSDNNDTKHFITGHGEYSAMTLDKEYRRDTAKGLKPSLPFNYYPADDPNRIPTDRWHGNAVTIMCNWLDSLRHD